MNFYQYVTINNIKPLLRKVVPNKVIRFFKKNKALRIYFKNKLWVIDSNNRDIGGMAPVFFYDHVSNFGDTIGPYLVHKITGKPVINISNIDIPGIMAVGSILQLIDRHDLVVWGSGLIEIPNKKVRVNIKKYNPQILSLRGELTKNQLEKAGIKIPEKVIYGDPALVLPFFFQPNIKRDSKIAICPHYIHKNYFLENVIIDESIKFVDVQQDMESVVKDIISSKVCISTSLHGLIISQAYNIPWVWLEIEDENLKGSDFKFKDFFSTLDYQKVKHIKVNMSEVENLDFNEIAKQANLPDKNYDAELILKCLTDYLERT